MQKLRLPLKVASQIWVASIILTFLSRFLKLARAVERPTNLHKTRAFQLKGNNL